MSDDKKKEELTAEQYRVCRLKGTEQPFAGQYWDYKGVGDYLCVCCGAMLFRSEDKFDSGTGWPSYLQPFSAEAIKEVVDESHGMRRVEVLCQQCDAHLGHVFPDGPQPTGLRYCINSAALRFLDRAAK